MLVVKSSIGMEIRDAIDEKDKEIILWLADLFEVKIKSANTPKIRTNRFIQHHDPKLMRYMSKGVPSSKSTFDFFPQSHIVLKMKAVILSIEPNGNKISMERLGINIRGNYYFFNSKRLVEEVDLIIQNGLKIGFLSRNRKDPSEIQVKAVSSRTESLEKE